MAVGLFMFYCTIAILADSFLGLDIGLGITHAASAGAHTLAGVARLIGHTLLASSITALIGAAWMIIWFAQVRFLFDPAARDLIIVSHGMFGWRQRRVSVAACHEFHLHYVGPLYGYAASRSWQLRAMFQDGHMERLAIIPTLPGRGAAGIDMLQTSLQEASRLPVIKHEGRYVNDGDGLRED